MRVKTKKATFNLPTSVLAALDEVIANGAAPSKNALVEQALLKEIQEVRRKTRRELWQQGARDKLLLKDISNIEAAFLTADAETIERIA